MNKILKIVLNFAVLIGKNLIDEIVIYLLKFSNRNQRWKIQNELKKFTEEPKNERK